MNFCMDIDLLEGWPLRSMKVRKGQNVSFQAKEDLRDFDTMQIMFWI